MRSSQDISRLVSLLWITLLTSGGLACQRDDGQSGQGAGAGVQNETGTSSPSGIDETPSEEKDVHQPPQGSEGPFMEGEDTYLQPQEGPATDCPDAGLCDQAKQTLDWWLWRAVDQNWGIMEISTTEVIEQSVPETLEDGTVTIPWIRLTARFEIHQLFATGPTGLSPDAQEWQYVGPEPGCYPPEFSDAFAGTEADRATYVTHCVDLPGGQNVFGGGRYLVLLNREGFIWAFPVVDGMVGAEATLTGAGASLQDIGVRIAEFESGIYTPPK